MTVVSKTKALVAMGVGAGAMYLLDPDRGRARRARTTDQAKAALRRQARSAQQQARFTGGQAAGAAARAAGAGDFQPASETDLREHLRQVIAELPFSTVDVTVDVSGGVAALRGQVAEPGHLEETTNAVAQVPGVASVESYLHLPGEPAPNKAAARQAAG